MPANSIATPQNRSFSLWNIWSKKEESSHPTSENKFPLLPSVVSVSPSTESFNLRELEEGRHLREAVEMLQKDNRPVRPAHNSCARGWKIAAALVGVVCGVGSAALYITHMISSPSPSHTLMPVDEVLPPIIDTSITAYPPAIMGSAVVEGPKVAALYDEVNIVDRINNEITQFGIYFHIMSPQEILNNTNFLKSLITNSIYNKILPEQRTNSIGNRINEIIRTKISPLINTLNTNKVMLKENEINDDLNQLRIESLNKEINDLNQAKVALNNLVVRLNKVYIDYIANGKN